MIDFFKNLTLSGIADILSVVGFFMTLWTLFTVRRLQADYHRRGIAQYLQQELIVMRQQLQICLEADPIEQNAVLTLIKSASVYMKEAVTIMGKSHKSNATEAIAHAEAFYINPTHYEKCLEFYFCVDQVIRALEISKVNRSWRS